MCPERAPSGLHKQAKLDLTRKVGKNIHLALTLERITPDQIAFETALKPPVT